MTDGSPISWWCSSPSDTGSCHEIKCFWLFFCTSYTVLLSGLAAGSNLFQQSNWTWRDNIWHLQPCWQQDTSHQHCPPTGAFWVNHLFNQQEIFALVFPKWRIKGLGLAHYWACYQDDREALATRAFSLAILGPSCVYVSDRCWMFIF